MAPEHLEHSALKPQVELRTHAPDVELVAATEAGYKRHRFKRS